jgi:hypothetical protein
VIGTRLREESSEDSQVLSCDFHRNHFSPAFAMLNAFTSGSRQRHKGKAQANAAKYQFRSQAKSVRVVSRLGVKRKGSRTLARSCRSRSPAARSFGEYGDQSCQRNGMENISKYFLRDRHGAWVCVERADLHTPSGRIQVTPGSRFMPGTTFMGVDLAKWLDEQQDRLSR